MNQISVERLQSELAFVRRHPDSPIALEVLQFNLFRPESMMYYNVIDSFYSRISKPLKNTPTGKQLLKDLNNWRNSQVGRKAPSFVVKDLKRRSLSLKDFYNKNYVLIDFWASWCLPCREEFPNLKQAYAKYQSKGLQIINASIDEDLVKWKAAIYKDGIQSWKHFAVKENKPSVSSLYFVIGVPTKVLIDKQGRIIERWVGSTPEYTEALKNKLKTIFK
jgi:thiol-disulfide isomerase/thioredoxin